MIPTPLADSIKPLYLGFHTAKRMEARQLAGIGLRKARESIVPRLPVDFDHYYEQRVPANPSIHLEEITTNTATLRNSLDEMAREQFRRQAREAANGVLTFLNRTLHITDETGVNWYDDRFEELPLLWALKLYAFQPLAWVYNGCDPGTKRAVEYRDRFDEWIQDWIDTIEIARQQYLRRAWTPWAVSLRILHLARYLAWRTECNSKNSAIDAGNDGAFERKLVREIYKNALFLENHVEWDVGGNHLIENGAALTVAGVLFENRTWTGKGIKILSTAADTQFLDDGFHFERSPMYHVLTITRYLTVCDLLKQSDRPTPDELRQTAERGTTFLQYLRPPDGRIPLLNDSVYGQALALDDCLRYADAIGFKKDGDQWSRPTTERSTQGNSGYRWLSTDAGKLLVDGGPVGPPHLPGHSHSDTLSVLLWLADRPVVTDTGTIGYVSECRRRDARGVRGHNTIQVGNREPIAIGGKYLMGARTEPTTRYVPGNISLFEGYYEANPYNEPSYVHHRSIHAGDSWWLIRDTVDGHDGSAVRGRLHLHPSVTPTLESTGRVRLRLSDDAGTAFVYPVDETRISITTGAYFPEFGTATERPVLTLHARNTEYDPATSGCLITQQNLETVRLRTDSAGLCPESVQVDTEKWSLEAVQLLDYGQ